MFEMKLHLQQHLSNAKLLLMNLGEIRQRAPHMSCFERLFHCPYVSTSICHLIFSSAVSFLSGGRWRAGTVSKVLNRHLIYCLHYFTEAAVFSFTLQAVGACLYSVQCSEMGSAPGAGCS